MKNNWLIVGIIFLVVSLTAVVVMLQSNDSRQFSVQTNSELVVTTVYPLYYFAKTIAGDRIVVERLIKPGDNVHSFTPTPQNMVTLTQTKIFISLGGSLEPWANKLAAATNVKLLQLDEMLTLRKSDAHQHEKHDKHDDHDSHNKETNRLQNDPHIWLSFDNNKKIIETMTREFITLYPQHTKIFEENAATLLVKLYRLDDLYTKQLRNCHKKMILVGHDAFGYMEDAYGFEAQSITGAYDNAAPNAKKIAELTDLIKRNDIKILFFEPLDSNKNAIQLAHDMNLTLEPLYALGNIPLKDEAQYKDFFTLLQFNLAQLKKGLECQ